MILSIAFFQVFAHTSAIGDPSGLVQASLKPNVRTRVIEKFETRSYATLNGKKYQFYSTALIKRSLKKTKRVLTNYSIYEKLIPFVNKVQFDSASEVLRLEGGVWGFKLVSWIRFKDVSENEIRFEIIRGNFRGLKGKFLFEAYRPHQTLVYVEGNLIQKTWPPKIVMEEGAEVVLDYTAKKMRSAVEDGQDSDLKGESKKRSAGGKGVPKPRTHL